MGLECTIVYGGGAVGLMGAVADAALEEGGEVVGVIPTDLFTREVGHRGLTELIEVDSMHTRKQKMFDLADAFIALPGGFGTLDELLEVATWSQLGLHEKPILAIDHDDFFQPLLAQIDRAAHRGVMKPENRDIVSAITEPSQIASALETYSRAAVPKWID